MGKDFIMGRRRFGENWQPNRRVPHLERCSHTRWVSEEWVMVQTLLRTLVVQLVLHQRILRGCLRS